MANFTTAAAILLDLEGGFAPSDVGNGPVKYGITADFLRRIGRPFDVVSIRSLTEEDAIELYYEYFWKPIKGDQIRDQVMANLLLASVVHAGVPRAVRLLQEVAEVKADGVVGPKTLKALEAVPAEVYADRIWRFYESLAIANPRVYLGLLGGWRGRLEKLVPDWSQAEVERV